MTLLEDTEQIAYSMARAAELLSISRTTLWREVKRGRLLATRYKTIPRSELIRWLAAETASARQKAA
jgi:predicted DNA-binding transcriptional regulator AlpA